MDAEERFELVAGVAEEIVTEQELREVLETESSPVAYDGFEPSGLAHLPVGVYRPLLLRDLLRAGLRFKLLLADSFAWINNKLGGDLEKIRLAGEYFVEVWKAAGVDMRRVEVVWHSDFMDDREYWRKVILIAKSHTLKRTLRSLTIAGREGELSNPTAFVFYPSMQCADVFHLDVDICQLGMDQRKVNMLAREMAGKLGRKPPVVVSHRMLPALQPGSGEKMSKSVPESAIFVHDSEAEIREKLRRAYCPMKEVQNNPVLEYAKEIVFRAFGEMLIERPERYGGDVSYATYGELAEDFAEGRLHPQDLKDAVAGYLNRLIAPVREHFEKNSRARELYLMVKSCQITR